jgi:NAD(P)-dependent dehydrogenase (short-subunit alcohol dehydrogenase family)
VSRLAGKVVLITGAASGIGRRTASLFAAEGALLVLGDRDAKMLAETAETIGPQVCATATVDVRRETDVERLVQLSVERFGKLDIAVNSAGIGTLSPIHQHPTESWQEVLDICLSGVFLAVKHESRQMIEQGTPGAIVNVGSINGRQAAEGMVAYCSAKAGVEMLTKVAGLELGGRGIRVNAISPGFVETPMTAFARDSVRRDFLKSIPMGRPGQPDDIARAALFLVSEDAAWVNGETLVVDGGELNREYPRLLTMEG